MSQTIDDRTNEDAYRLLRHLYKYIPYYNQLKGSYTGMQFVLNTMGLNLALTELWATKNDIHNFSTETELVREDEINTDREIKVLSGQAVAYRHFLTSRFDADLMQTQNISFEAYNSVAPTVFQVISQMRPITRVFRKLFYISRINSNIYFKYLAAIKNIKEDINSYTYTWNLTDPRIVYRQEYDNNTKGIYSLFIPYQAETAIFVNDDVNTMKNTYFNLFDLENKFYRSNQKTLEFTLQCKKKSDENYDTIDYMFTIGKDVDIKTDRSGITLILHDNATSILIDFFGTRNIPNINDIDMRLKFDINMVLGTQYAYQGDPITANGLLTELSNDILSEWLSMFMIREKPLKH